MYKTRSNLGWTGAISEKSSCHEVVSEFFATNTPDPPHWILNSCFGAFLSVWVQLGPFHYCTKLGANWAELVQFVQKFEPWSCDGNFRYGPGPTHWTLNSSFHAFRSVWLHLWSFHNCTKHGAKQAELLQLMQKFGPQSHIGHFCNERTWSTPLDPKLMFWCVL